MIYIFWSDYDGVYVKERSNRKEAEEAVAEILEGDGENDYGETVYAVVEGKKLIMREEPVEIIKIKLRDK